MDKDGKVLVARDKRITGKHIRDIEKKPACRGNPCAGRLLVWFGLAKNVIDADTGEVIAKANDELTEESLRKLRDAGIKRVEVLYTNEVGSRRVHFQRLAFGRNGRSKCRAHCGFTA